MNPEQKLFVVADGMGGHAAGEVASKVAVDAINEFVCLTSGDEEITWPFGLDENISYDGNRLKTAIRHANRQGPRGHPESAASTRAWPPRWPRCSWTATSANLAPRGRQPGLPAAAAASITQLTTDHSWVNEQIQSGVISAEQARSHPLRNVVTRALGGQAPTCGRHPVAPHGRRGDAPPLLGRPHHHGRRTRRSRASSTRRRATSRGRRRPSWHEANAQGGEDNITVVLLKFEE